MARPIFNAGMFGVPTGLDMTGLKTSPMTPTIAAAASPPRRRGLSGMLGGVVNLANGVVDQDRQPNFLDFLLGGQNRVDAMRQAPYNRLRMQAAQQQMDQEAAQFKQQAQDRGQWDEYVAQLPAAEQARARFMGPTAYMAATAPLSRDQQADEDFRRAQLAETIRHNRASEGVDWARTQNATPPIRPLRGPDAALMTAIQEADTRSQGLVAAGHQFLDANGRLGTGDLSNGNPLAGLSAIGSPDAAVMDAASQSQRSMMRPAGSGPTSDYEQRIYALGAMGRNRTGPQNQAIGRAQEVAARLNRARRFFYEDYALQYGTLNGAERAFQGSPEFQQTVRQNPIESFGGQSTPQVPQPEAAPQAGAARQPTRAELEAERDRRLRARGVMAPYNNQPGGYSGR